MSENPMSASARAQTSEARRAAFRARPPVRRDVCAAVFLRSARHASMVKARYPVVAIFFLTLIALCAIFAPQLAPKDPNRM